MRYLVTGGSGFVGSHIVDRLISQGHGVTVYDNLSSGFYEFIKHHEDNSNLKFVNADLLDKEVLNKEMEGIDFVFHMAANPDIQYGIEHTDHDLKQNTIATYNVLETMRLNNVKKIGFASTSAVIGEAKTIPTPEDYAPLQPLSLYGASKLACEGLITAYCHTFDFQSWIFRFANIIGERGITHMVLIDFIKKLRKDPTKLEILGDGQQSKPLLLVNELTEAMFYIVENSDERINVYNCAGPDRIKNIDRIAEVIIEELGLKDVKIGHTGGKRGWRGDVPIYQLSTKKLSSLGFTAKYSSEEALRLAVKSLVHDTHKKYGIRIF